MVAKITSPHSILRALNYNEKKVQAGSATCIYAGNFLQTASHLNFHQKINRFQHLINLNQRTKKSNTLHISLNFDPSEKMSQETLRKIAKEYMEKIGFGRQPFLVYEHQDAGHPHIHIVTTNIQSNGQRVDTYNIGKLKSEPARRELEIEFGLVPAKESKYRQNETRQPKFEYGKTETKRSMVNILDRVIVHYNYRSLAAFNAILQTFNMVADTGKEGGRIQKFRGLRYQALDAKGQKTGVPIKASSIYSKPTLGYLEKMFMDNRTKPRKGMMRIKIAIDQVLLQKPVSLSAFMAELDKVNINTVIRRDDQGRIYGMTFVDHTGKSVFNGSEIGKSYSAAGILKHFEPDKSKSRSLSYSEIKTKQVSPIQTHGILRDLLKDNNWDPKPTELPILRRRKKKRKPII